MRSITPTLELFVQGGKLRYRLRGAKPTPELLGLLSLGKVALISLLAPAAAPEPASKPLPIPGQNGHIGQKGPTAPSGGRPAGNCVHSGHSVHDSERNGRGEEAAAPRHLLVSDPALLPTVAAALDTTALVGLDLETTGLDPRSDRVRLLSLAVDTIDGGRFTYLVDYNACDPAPLWEALAERELVLHNAAFDLAFLARLGFTPTGKVRDTRLLSQLLHGARQPTGFHSLQSCVERDLSRSLDKEQQRSDWSGDLTAEQLRYAAADADVLVPLYERLQQQIQGTRQEQAADIEARCLPAMVWLANAGVHFDQEEWELLAVAATTEAERLAQQLDAAAPQRPGHLPQAGAWNWNSPQDVAEALALVDCPVKATDDDTLAGIRHPLAELLRDYRSATKGASTYGAAWLQHVAADGRVYPSWRQIGCITGRMACGAPNLQNVPQGAHRRCFSAPPRRVLVKADYSQIELRIAAKITGDRRMLDAYRHGEDLHTLTARQMVGRDEVTPQERKLAKPVNFGLIYGLGAASLRVKAKAEYGLEMGPAESERYRRAFFASYPGIASWHRRLQGEATPEVRTLSGRRCPVPERYFYGTRANYIVQGTGGDGIKVALALLWERRDQCPGAFPVLVVHDEIVVEADAAQADAAAAWLKAAMVDAMAPLLDPVPVEVEVKVGRTWGGD
jgi:DNA polymerase-1